MESQYISECRFFLLFFNIFKICECWAMDILCGSEIGSFLCWGLSGMAYLLLPHSVCLILSALVCFLSPVADGVPVAHAPDTCCCHSFWVWLPVLFIFGALNGSSWHCYGPRQMPPLQNAIVEPKYFYFFHQLQFFPRTFKSGEENHSEVDGFNLSYQLAFISEWFLSSHICRMKASLALGQTFYKNLFQSGLGLLLSSNPPKIM